MLDLLGKLCYDKSRIFWNLSGREDSKSIYAEVGCI